MTTLKNSDRDEILRRAMTEAFSPRFASIAASMQLDLRAQLKDRHPKFLALMKNEDTRGYVAFNGVNRMYLIDNDAKLLSAAEPRYGKPVSMPPPRSYLDSDEYFYLKAQDTQIPSAFGDVKIANDVILATYTKAWHDYSAARMKLSALLNSYKTREKFETDFPEFSKYLPAIEVKPSLPMVIVKDVRDELAALGIAPK